MTCWGFKMSMKQNLSGGRGGGQQREFGRDMIVGQRQFSAMGGQPNSTKKVTGDLPAIKGKGATSPKRDMKRERGKNVRTKK